MQPLIRQTLQFTTTTNKREDYETFLQSLIETDYYKFHSKNFKIKLIDYRKTKEHYKGLIIGFEEKFKNCLDANFLIDNELKVFKDFLNEVSDTDNYIVEIDFITKDFRRNGFLWVTTGKTVLIEDFFLMKDFIYKQQFPINNEDLQQCWESAYYDLEQAAKGCAEGLYVQFLKDKKREINSPYYELENNPFKYSKESLSAQNTEDITEPLLENISESFDFLANTGTKEEFISLINGLLVKGEEDFKGYFKYFNYKLSDYPGTQIIFDELKNNFLNKFKVSLDKDFLIEAELSNYYRYQNFKQVKERKYSNDFVLRGFFWITTGEEIFIKDFYLLQNGTYEYFEHSFPINEDSLLRRWIEVSNDIEQVARGCAYGLYVHYLKHFKEKEMILTDEGKQIIKGSTNEQLPETIQTDNQKLKWNGTPSQFGFIIDLLVKGGYLEKPTSSFTKDANFYLHFFDIETTTATLAKELSEPTNSVSTKNRNKFTIPKRYSLD